MPVPFNDLTRDVTLHRSSIDAAIARTLDSGWFVLGGEGRAFEAEFAETMGSSHAVGVGSGTDAIELALRALGIGPGDEVITQANTCVPTVAAIERAGASPVLCDVDPDTATMAPASLAAAIGDATRAVIPVHLYGQCADMASILEVAERAGLAVVEDCAQAVGATAAGRGAGTMGALGCFSFYPTKNLGALGDGGAVITDDPELAERVRLIRQYGQTDRYHHEERGVNSRLDEVQAAILRDRLTRLGAGNTRRAEIAAVYREALSGTPVRPLDLLARHEHVYHLFVVRVAARDAYQARLRELGVESLIHYPRPIHEHPPYRALGDRVLLDASERLSQTVLSLPLFPELSDEEVAAVAAAASAAASA